MKRFVITLAITLIYCYGWIGLEILFYGSPQDRIVDNIMMLLFIPIIWKATGTIEDKKGK